jgi:phosphate transport system substrate-binding protein
MKKDNTKETRMLSKRYTFITVLLTAAVLLSACAPAATPTAATSAANTPAANTPAAATTEAPTESPTLAPGSVQINGAGATFPQPVYAAWTYAYQYVDPAVAINYQGIGSGGGKKAIIDGTVDFAGSDSLLKDEEYTSGIDLQMYPVLAGAVVPIYNITFNENAPAQPLILDGTTLVGIYNGTISMWNDPAILALNPDLASYLPAEKITAVHRSDGSGTTELFTKALTSFSPEWTAGGASSVEWPVDKAGNGIGGKGNPGVAAQVQNTPNSIGYVELSYALSNQIAYASMINKSGATVVANGASIESAMADFADNFTDKLTNTIVDAPGAGSWPIAGYTYIILHTTSSTDCVKTQKLVEYIRWSLTDSGAAKIASDMGYSVLPEAVRTMVLDKLGEVTCNGTTVLK